MSRASAILSVIVAVCVAVVGAVGTSGAQDNSPHTTPVAGTFTASPVNVMQRTCEGQDGTYLEIRGRFAGTSVSPDPRLDGCARVHGGTCSREPAHGFRDVSGAVRNS
jgi:hypothetical protein